MNKEVARNSVHPGFLEPVRRLLESQKWRVFCRHGLDEKPRRCARSPRLLLHFPGAERAQSIYFYTVQRFFSRPRRLCTRNGIHHGEKRYDVAEKSRFITAKYTFSVALMADPISYCALTVAFLPVKLTVVVPPGGMDIGSRFSKMVCGRKGSPVMENSNCEL